MRYFKIIFIMFLLLIIPTSIQAVGIEEVTDFGGAKYYVDAVKEENTLPNGVKHYTHTGFTSAEEGEVTDMGMNVDETFVPGKFYPQQVSMLEIPTDAGVELIPWAYIDEEGWHLKTVRQIARNYEALNPGTKVLAAVNGDFFDIQGGKMYPFTPNNVHASQGNIFKSYYLQRAVGFLNDGSTKPLIGGEKPVRNEKPTLEILNMHGEVIYSFDVDTINADPSGDEIGVIYPKFGILNNGENPSSIPVDVVDAYIIDATYVIPFTEVKAVYGYESDDLDFFGRGTLNGFGSTSLVKDQFAIKTTNPLVIDALEEAVEVRVQYQFTGAFEGVDNIMGVNQTVMKDGARVHNIVQRAPRTMVGVKEDGTILLTVVDGRRPTQGLYGVAMAEMAAVMKHYGAVDAYNLDGGGSSTMIILDEETEDFRVTNTYSDGSERSNANAILVVMRTPELSFENTIISDTEITFNPTIIKHNNYDFNEVYIKLNNEYISLGNGSATFKNLSKDTTYPYEVFIKKEDVYETLYIKGDIKTGLTMPQLLSMTIEYRNNDLFFNFNFEDPDDTFVEGTVIIGERKTNIVSGSARFTDAKGSGIRGYSIIIIINTNNLKGDVELVLNEYDIYANIDVVFDTGYNQLENHFYNIFN